MMTATEFLLSAYVVILVIAAFWLTGRDIKRGE